MSATPERQDAGDTPQPEDGLRLIRMIHGFRVTQILAVAAQLGIADLLADGPKSAAELAERTKTHTGALHRLLRALAGNGVLAEDDRGRFALTPLGGLLRTDDPGSARALAIYNETSLSGGPGDRCCTAWRPEALPSSGSTGCPSGSIGPSIPNPMRSSTTP